MPNPPETRRVRLRVQKCTRGSTCGRVFPSPAGLTAGGFLSNPHPHPRVPSLNFATKQGPCFDHGPPDLIFPVRPARKKPHPNRTEKYTGQTWAIFSNPTRNSGWTRAVISACRARRPEKKPILCSPYAYGPAQSKRHIATCF